MKDSDKLAGETAGILSEQWLLARSPDFSGLLDLLSRFEGCAQCPGRHVAARAFEGVRDFDEILEELEHGSADKKAPGR